MAAHQAPPSLGFSRQEHWSGLPFPSPMRESEKWKGSRSVVSDSSWPHGLQPTRLLRPWDFPGKTTGVGCHHLLWESLSQSLFILLVSSSSQHWLKPPWAGTMTVNYCVPPAHCYVWYIISIQFLNLDQLIKAIFCHRPNGHEFEQTPGDSEG